MTTLEVVEAVQRSLENEGFLQLIRAQLRSNVLRIISSGPDYSPQVGKAVALTQTKQGTIVVQLVKDLMEEYGLRESLAVFEAEVGLNVQDSLDRDRLQKELNMQSVRNGSILEGLVSQATRGTIAVESNMDRSQANISNDSKYVPQEQPRSSAPALDHHRNEAKGEESISEDDGDDGDVNYSQIEEVDPPFAASANSSAAPSPAKVSAPPKDESFDSYSGAQGTRSLDAKAPPTLHSSFHQSKLDESSSFEADSPARPAPSNSTAAQQKFVATVLEDSFAEEPEEDISVEEDILEEEREEEEEGTSKEKEVDPVISSQKEADAPKAQFKSGPATGHDTEDGDEDGAEDGPEYESDQGGAKEDDRSPGVSATAKEDRKQFSDSDSGSDSNNRSVRGSGGSASLRPAVADDFDPMDRNTAKESAVAAGHGHNRVAVRRAGGGEVAESKSPSDTAPGAKASVFRLGQSSISRSQLGWGAEANPSGVDDRSDEEGRGGQGGADSSGDERRGTRGGGLSRFPAATTAGRGARYSGTSQMEAVSFDSDEDEHQPSPARTLNRRSSNQESENENENDASTHGREVTRGSEEDFEMEDGGDDDDDDVSFGDDEGELPQGSAGAFPRKAFESSHVVDEDEKRGGGEEDEEEEEYGDDDFVEDEEENSEDAHREQVVSHHPAASTGLFQVRSGAGALSAQSSSSHTASAYRHGVQQAREEDSDQSSVEEEIEEEDNMSVGDADSDEDHGFGSPAVDTRKKQDKTTSAAEASGGGMFRAGRSGALPGVSSNTAKSTNFDSILNSFEADSDDDGDGGVSSYMPSSSRAAAQASSSITSRMREIDSQLEELEHSDPHLARLRGQSEDENSVASEDIDAMEFSTGGGPENDSESSGEGSFSFLDSSSKK